VTVSMKACFELFLEGEFCKQSIPLYLMP